MCVDTSVLDLWRFDWLNSVWLLSGTRSGNHLPFVAARVASVVQALQNSTSAVSPTTHNQAAILQTALSQIPNATSHLVLKTIAVRLGQGNHKEVSFQYTKVQCEKLVVQSSLHTCWQLVNVLFCHLTFCDTSHNGHFIGSHWVTSKCFTVIVNRWCSSSTSEALLYHKLAPDSTHELIYTTASVPAPVLQWVSI